MLRYFLATFAVTSILAVWIGPKVETFEDLNSSLASNPATPSTTVVILNWSRLENVKRIVDQICHDLLEDTVQSIIVWNNNPKPLAYLTDFEATSCPESTLRIINSPENIYFQARYLACAEADTPLCFIQDDDYLVSSNSIRALSLRMQMNNETSIHLQPPADMLSSELRSLTIDKRIHTTFSWLGYGTIINRSSAIDFLALLKELNFSEEELKMADNYFTILANRMPERWFDNLLELGGGDAFTQGAEGDERNKKYILLAAGRLDKLLAQRDAKALPYISLTSKITTPPHDTVSRATCQQELCLLETNISLIPDNVYSEMAPSSARQLIFLEQFRASMLERSRKDNYLSHPPTSAVDGKDGTAFRSFENAKAGEWLLLDMFRLLPRLRRDNITLQLVVDATTEKNTEKFCNRSLDRQGNMGEDRRIFEVY